MLEIQPIDWDEFCEFIRAHHEHHDPPQGWKFGLAVNDGVRVVGVASVGRPVSRHFDDGATLEVTRLCTDRTKNAASRLWGRCAKIAFLMGYTRVISYILESEDGVSLKAAGWKEVSRNRGGGSWSRASRLRVDKHPTEQKILWETTSLEVSDA